MSQLAATVWDVGAETSDREPDVVEVTPRPGPHVWGTASTDVRCLLVSRR